MGRELWRPQGMDASQIGMGGHAMCVISYDDRKFGGTFQIMNSWTEKWATTGGLGSLRRFQAICEGSLRTGSAAQTIRCSCHSTGMYHRAGQQRRREKYSTPFRRGKQFHYGQSHPAGDPLQDVH